MQMWLLNLSARNRNLCIGGYENNAKNPEKNNKIILCHCANEHISQQHVVMSKTSIHNQNFVEMRADLGRAFAVSINYESICNISSEQSSILATSALTFVFILTSCIWYQLVSSIFLTSSSCQMFCLFLSAKLDVSDSQIIIVTPSICGAWRLIPGSVILCTNFVDA